MSRVILTDARVKALRPRKTAYDIRDGKLGASASGSCPRAANGSSSIPSIAENAFGRSSATPRP